jgi:hypothetical protein
MPIPTVTLLLMADRSIRILTPVLPTAIAEDEFETLRAELEKIGATEARWPMTESLLIALDLFTGPNDTAPIYHPTETGRDLLVRATDHLRNLGYTGDLLTLRNRLMLTGDRNGHKHLLHFLDGRPPALFLRYSMPYVVGDRLVSNVGEELLVTRFNTAGGLVVEPWPEPTD